MRRCRCRAASAAARHHLATTPLRTSAAATTRLLTRTCRGHSPALTIVTGASSGLGRDDPHLRERATACWLCRASRPLSDASSSVSRPADPLRSRLAKLPAGTGAASATLITNAGVVRSAPLARFLPPTFERMRVPRPAAHSAFLRDRSLRAAQLLLISSAGRRAMAARFVLCRQSCMSPGACSGAVEITNPKAPSSSRGAGHHRHRQQFSCGGPTRVFPDREKFVQFKNTFADAPEKPRPRCCSSYPRFRLEPGTTFVVTQDRWPRAECAAAEPAALRRCWYRDLVRSPARCSPATAAARSA